MSTLVGHVQCGECGSAFGESPSLAVDQRAPCPSCGSLRRLYNVLIEEAVRARSGLSLKQKRLGFKKPIYEEVGKPDLHRQTGRLSFLVRVIDRLNNRYRENITDIESGVTLRNVDEPLTEHVNRGSAKGRAPKF